MRQPGDDPNDAICNLLQGARRPAICEHAFDVLISDKRAIDRLLERFARDEFRQHPVGAARPDPALHHPDNNPRDFARKQRR